jgi:acyl-CoA thioesterase II
VDQPFSDLVSLEEFEPDVFIAEPLGGGFLFGGLTLALALRAAAATVDNDELSPHALHAHFARAGEWRPQLRFSVERLSDSRRFALRRVSVSQDGNRLVEAMVSFHSPEEGIDWSAPLPFDVPGPDASIEISTTLANVDPMEVRRTRPKRSEGIESVHPYWARLRQPIDGPSILQACALTFISDYLVIWSAHDAGDFVPPSSILTLNHSLWFHRTVDAHDWLLYSADPQTMSGALGLSRGTVRTREGLIVATFVQEDLIRPQRPR